MPKRKASGGGKGTSSAVQKVNDNVEKTTLGDLDALSDLKADLEKGEEK